MRERKREKVRQSKTQCHRAFLKQLTHLSDKLVFFNVRHFLASLTFESKTSMLHSAGIPPLPANIRLGKKCKLLRKKFYTMCPSERLVVSCH